MAKEYIERKAAINAAILAHNRIDNNPCQNIRDCIGSIPAANVVPVVRCSECKYNEHCFTQSFVRDEGIIPFDPDTWFCADGKRTDGDGDG